MCAGPRFLQLFLSATHVVCQCTNVSPLQAYHLRIPGIGILTQLGIKNLDLQQCAKSKTAHCSLLVQAAWQPYRIPVDLPSITRQFVLMGIACTGCLSGVDCCIVSFKALCTQLQKHKLPVVTAHHQESSCALVQHHKIAQAVRCSCGTAFIECYTTLHLGCSTTSTASAKILITCPTPSQGCCNISTRPTRQGQHLPESLSPVQ